MNKQRRTPFFVLCLLAVTGAAMAAGGRGHAVLGSAPSASPGAQAQGRGGGSGRHDPRLDARNAPALAPDRKVNEQDCTKPVDLSAGNLKCK
jgi:hypothetical protein